MQPLPDLQGDFSNLSRDLFHVISPFVPDEELYSLVKSGKEVSEISRRYLRPTQENFDKAVDKGDVAVVRNLLRYKQIDPAADDNYAIRSAIDYGETGVVKVLLQDKRVDPSANDNYAIRWASIDGRTEIVKLLLQDPRVDPSAKNNYAIQWASRMEHMEIVNLLLQDPRVSSTYRCY